MLVAAVLVVRADRKLEEWPREIVAGIAPIEPRVRHQDREAREQQRHNRNREHPMRQPHPQRMALADFATQIGLRFQCSAHYLPLGSVRFDARLTWSKGARKRQLAFRLLPL